MKKIIHILKKEDKRLLHSFLKANNALTQFKRNCRYNGVSIPHSMNDYILHEVIMCAFCWDHQPEGNEYWCDLHQKWKLFLKHRKIHK